MKKNLPYIFMILVIMAASAHAIYNFGLKKYFSPTYAFRENSESLPRITKVGNIVGTKIYIQSIDALNQKYKDGFRYFLVALNQTSDHRAVCIGPWQQLGRQIFPAYVGNWPTSYEDFKQQPTYLNIRPCDFDELLNWLGSHQDAHMVVVSYANFGADMNYLKTHANGMHDRMIILAGTEAQASLARNAGFGRVYLPLATFSNWTDLAAAIARITQVKPDALLIPENQLEAQNDLIKELWKSNIPVFANPVESCEELAHAIKFGAKGLITNTLTPYMCH